jgi:hypothetical protein
MTGNRKSKKIKKSIIEKAKAVFDNDFKNGEFCWAQHSLHPHYPSYLAQKSFNMKKCMIIKWVESQKNTIIDNQLLTLSNTPQWHRKIGI